MLWAFKNFIANRTSQSAGVGIRASNFNRCNDAIVRTREISLLHASCNFHYSITYKQSLHAMNGLIAVGGVGNLLCRHPSYQKYSDPLEPISGYATGSIPGGVVNFNLKIFNLGARRGGDVQFLIARLYITGLD